MPDAGAATLEERVRALARQRTVEGYMADVHLDGERGGVVLVEHHCPICTAATACPGFCRSELELFRDTLGPDVTVERTAHILAGDVRCAYLIRPGRTRSGRGQLRTGVSVSRPERSNVPGRASVNSPCSTMTAPFTITVVDSFGLAVHPRRAGRQVGAGDDRAGRDRRGVEDDEVGVGAGRRRDLGRAGRRAAAGTSVRSCTASSSGSASCSRTAFARVVVV